MSAKLSPPSSFTANNLVFEDNFSGSQLNAIDWNTYMTSNGTQGSPWDSNGLGGSGVGGAYDADYDEPYEVSVNNGLTLNAVQQSVIGENYLNGQLAQQTFPVTAGVVDTYGKMEFDGGYLQISMKQSSGDGSWPSLWLLPGAGAGSVGNNFEVDMQEGGYTYGTNGANPNDVFSYHLHVGDTQYGGSIVTDVDLSASYNTYAINWIPGQSITWYLNGASIAEITSAQAPIPNELMELILSNQVATSAASSWRTSLDSSTPQSVPMQVGDVQLYQTPGSGEKITGSHVSTVPRSAPVVAITSGGGTKTQAKQTIAGTVDVADAGSTVSIYDGSVELGTASVAASGQWSTSLTLANQGINVLTAVDTNTAGTGTSAPADFTVQNSAPVVTITSAGETTTQAKQTIVGTVDVADAGSTVSIYDGSVETGTTSVAANGQWSASITLSNQGANVLTAVDTNTAGGTWSAPVDFTFNSAALTTVASSTSTVINSSTGNGHYSLGSDSYQITLGGFNNNVSAGNGDDIITVGAGDGTVNLGNGDDKVTLSGYGNTISAGNGSDTVTGGLGNNTVKLGDGANSVSLGGYYNYVSVGNGNSAVNAGAGNDSIVAGSGENRVALNGFYNSVQLSAGNDVVDGGQGYDNITLLSGSATLNLLGSYEHVALDAGASANIFDLGSSLSVDVASSTGNDVITGFTQDPLGIINLLNNAGGFSSVNAVLGALRGDGQGGSLLSLGAGGSIDIAGVAPTHLTSSNFNI